jgi:predicted nucleic-acid-binding Zn-ribbon protein
MTIARPCPECGQKNLYSVVTGSGGGYGPMLLPKLSSGWTVAEFQVVVCADCGLTRFVADAEALNRLPSARKWRKL